ncbi:hypothetical protein ACIBO2_28815 [Nonomuraea sp. NPDC050022]|uniref:hypothetical protein n=1 Tax=unclassified Nonomuraea TaxID=2593643 RepID=UPI0033F6C8BB
MKLLLLQKWMDVMAGRPLPVRHCAPQSPNCPGGASHLHGMSLWLTAGFGSGAASDSGQRVGSEYYMGNLNTDNMHILLHEMGHSFDLDDFYNWTPTGVCCFLVNYRRLKLVVCSRGPVWVKGGR